VRKLEKIRDSLYLCRNTCSAYVVKSRNSGLIIDCGDGCAIDLLESVGIRRIGWASLRIVNHESGESFKVLMPLSRV